MSCCYWSTGLSYIWTVTSVTFELVYTTGIFTGFGYVPQIHQQLTDKIAKTGTNSSGIYKLKRNTCNNSYVGHSSRSIATRHKKHTQFQHMHYTYWTTDMNMALQRKHWNYWNHAIREHEWIVGKLSICKPFTNVTYWSKNSRSMT